MAPEWLLNGGFFANGTYEADDVLGILGQETEFVFSVDFQVTDYKHRVLYSKHYRLIKGNNYGKGMCIIQIIDGKGLEFYMYIKSKLFGTCSTCDGKSTVKVRIFYASDLTALLNFIYTPKQLKRLLLKI